jgi:hypothetical protein
VPESNLALEENSLLPQAAQVNVPSASACRYSPVKGGSVPFSRSTRYCSGVNCLRQPSSVLGIGLSAMATSLARGNAARLNNET